MESLSRNNAIDRIVLGVVYQLSEKSKGTVKAGRESKRFEDTGRNDYSGFIVSMDIDHQLRIKTGLGLHIERGSRESTLGGSSTEKGQDYSISTSGRLTVFHRFSPKISGDSGLVISRDESAGVETLGSQVRTRIDNTLGLTLALDYWVQRWLNINAGFGFERRSSTFDELGFRNSVFSLGLRVAL